jgi:hypothetical protein
VDAVHNPVGPDEHLADILPLDLGYHAARAWEESGFAGSLEQLLDPACRSDGIIGGDVVADGLEVGLGAS